MKTLLALLRVPANRVRPREWLRARPGDSCHGVAEPALLVLDEAASALDVTTQVEILTNLICDTDRVSRSNSFSRRWRSCCYTTDPRITALGNLSRKLVLP